MKDAGKYVDGCDLCQWMKNRTEAPVGKLIANKILKEAIDIFDGRLHYKVTVSSKKRCDFGNMQ